MCVLLQFVSALFHTSFVPTGADEEAEPIPRARIVSLLQNMAQKLDYTIPPIWFGRYLTQALTNDCDFASCTHEHESMLDPEHDTVSGIRMARPSDFKLPRASRNRRRKQPPPPACRAAYAELCSLRDKLCSTVFDSDHDVKTCGSRMHVKWTHRDDFSLPVVATEETKLRARVVKLVLEQHLEDSQQKSVSSEDLLNLTERILSFSGLPAAVTPPPLGFFNRQAMGALHFSLSLLGRYSQRQKSARLHRLEIAQDQRRRGASRTTSTLCCRTHCRTRWRWRWRC